MGHGFARTAPRTPATLIAVAGVLLLALTAIMAATLTATRANLGDYVMRTTGSEFPICPDCLRAVKQKKTAAKGRLPQDGGCPDCMRQ